MTNKNGNLPWERNDYEPQQESREIKSKRAFIASAIAFVFLVLGYQTALLVHKAAVVAIVAREAEREEGSVEEKSSEPKTVDSQPEKASKQMSAKSYESKQPAKHSEPSQPANTSEQPKKQPSQLSKHQSLKNEVIKTHRPRELFRFNPNTIPRDSLVLLGFSEKQAESIVNYREKGGSFARPSDFARSYVVSDEMFARLKDYIDLPRLDINSADSAAFDALPGIGGYFAAKMVAQREALGGFYCCTEQLIDIRNFGQERYDALKDLIYVRSEDEDKGRLDIWTASEDVLKAHPYIRNYRTAHNIIVYRESSPKQEHTLDALVANGILTHETAQALSRIAK